VAVDDGHALATAGGFVGGGGGHVLSVSACVAGCCSDSILPAPLAVETLLSRSPSAPPSLAAVLVVY
jgi:hypothetical protein